MAFKKGISEGEYISSHTGRVRQEVVAGPGHHVNLRALRQPASIGQPFRREAERRAASSPHMIFQNSLNSQITFNNVAS